MNLDELVNSIPDSELELKKNFRNHIEDWKRNTESVTHLESQIGKWHGNVWFENTEVSNQFYIDYCSFRDESIKNIGGMTINERLYQFSLFDLWDLNDTETQMNIRKKLNAD
ncbi:hypothetical protein [Flavobacterium sp. GT3R68]|uniref:hypothetical protein n=1 Tax=Flavobacterium sp. GT3R68 TaxID=2594437 RepID=UPI000F87A9BC|nr:hypothetical protein [Flavobacterium sp. GT3R68]RTY85447.1 hypothetical protein EKL32_28570 [Flavobacterium sp. GSN2]TRW89350.1 hypothetical protein FNW07_13455 [Flavobacterium sp. GT3R68]